MTRLWRGPNECTCANPVTYATRAFWPGCAKTLAAIEWTIEYVRERKAFGKPVAGFQNTRFKLAEAATEAQVARVFVDRCIELLMAGKLDTATASMAKYWVSDLE